MQPLLQSLRSFRGVVPEDSSRNDDSSPSKGMPLVTQSPPNGTLPLLVSEAVHEQTNSDINYMRADGRSTWRSSSGGEDDHSDDQGRPSSGLWCEGNFMIFNRQHAVVRLWWWLTVALSCWNIFQVNLPPMV